MESNSGPDPGRLRQQPTLFSLGTELSTLGAENKRFPNLGMLQQTQDRCYASIQHEQRHFKIQGLLTVHNSAGAAPLRTMDRAAGRDAAAVGPRRGTSDQLRTLRSSPVYTNRDSVEV